jgi:hypothetical integral membrane protein (TIGR02206 family)
MAPWQLCALIFALAVPAILWWLGRRPHRERSAVVVRRAERGLALALVLAYAGDLLVKWRDGALTPEYALPLQLCDWALAATAAALWWRWRAGFDVAYFWGIGGTLQAILTPALSTDAHWFRLFGFFFIHAGIVAGVLHLLITPGFRPVWPRSLVRTVIVSEVYLVLALSANALTGGNYGFLAHRPEQRTVLDLFSDTHWIYVVQLNAVALAAFSLLYLPWAIADLRRKKSEPR